MSRTKKNETLVMEIFKPDPSTGISRKITRDEINKTELALCNNGNIRQNIPWTNKYIWDVTRQNNKPRGRPNLFQTTGFSDNNIISHPIQNNIRKELFSKYSGCLHCGNRKDLCIDHKNDMYNDTNVLNTKTQTINDFQVLCNKCNKDLKHQINVKEKNTGKLHLAKDLNILPFIKDKFNYPWELCITEYDETIIYCKSYTYWYDIEEFHRKRDIFITITRVLNNFIKNHFYKK